MSMRMCTVILGILPCWRKVHLVLCQPTLIGHVVFLVKDTDECCVSKFIKGNDVRGNWNGRNLSRRSLTYGRRTRVMTAREATPPIRNLENVVNLPILVSSYCCHFMSSPFVGSPTARSSESFLSFAPHDSSESLIVGFLRLWQVSLDSSYWETSPQGGGPNCDVQPRFLHRPHFHRPT